MRLTRKLGQRARLLVLATSALTYAGIATAATIAPVSVADLVNHSELIVDATVMDIRTEADPQSAAVRTLVTYQVHDVIKGNHTATTLELSFLGGISNGAGMEIPGLIYPELGERGVYFFENPHRRQVNPIYGWDQGHFIVDDPGAGDEAFIHTIGFDQVYDLNAGFAPSNGFRSKVAAGVETSPVQGNAAPMTIGSFKSKLRAIVGELETAVQIDGPEAE